MPALRVELEQAAEEVLDGRVRDRERRRGDHVDVLAGLAGFVSSVVAEHVRVAALGEHDLVLVARELGGARARLSSTSPSSVLSQFASAKP